MISSATLSCSNVSLFIFLNQYIDYSDDEEERAAKHKRKAKNRSRQTDGDDVQVVSIKKVSHDSKRKGIIF